MKTLKTTILGLVTLLTFGAANATSVKTENEKATVKYVISTYLNAIAHGQNAGLKDIIDNNATFSMVRGKQMVNYNKSEALAFFKDTENIEQNCKVTSSVNVSNTDMTVVRVDMKYDGFTRTNYVTVTNTSEGWKITNVHSVFKA